MMTTTRFSISVIIVALGAAPVLGQTASFQGLGDLPEGDIDSRAYEVSADGTTVVGDSVSSDGTEAFRWTAGTGMVALGALPPGNWTFSSTARCVIPGAMERT